MKIKLFLLFFTYFIISQRFVVEERQGFQRINCGGEAQYRVYHPNTCGYYNSKRHCINQNSIVEESFSEPNCSGKSTNKTYEIGKCNITFT
jgi:hypothetical protein